MTMSAIVVILLDAAIKGLVVLTLAAAASVGFRRSPASVRHLAWTLAVVGLCVLPIASMSVPRGRLGMTILPPSLRGDAPPSATRVAANPDPFRVEIDPGRIVPAHEVSSPSATPELRPSTPHWTTWIVSLWVGGAAIVMARLLASLVAAWHRGHGAAPITDGDLAVRLAEIALGYGIRRPIALKLAAGGTIPATWGLWRPVVLLPVEALDWPRDRLGAVLAHELAHVRRGDFLVQTLARVACAVHWFNPLAWLADHRLRVECEEASDDLVLDAGWRPSDYATHLVEVLMEARRRGQDGPLGAPVLAMAHRRGLEGRVRAILDGERPRSRPSSRRVALLVVAAAAFLLPLGLLRLEARAHDAPKLERPPQGMTIEVIGVSTRPSGPATWWGPDGTPLPQAPCDPAAEAADELKATPGQQIREVVARITGLPEGATLVWHPTQCESRGTAAPRKDGRPVPGLQRVVAAFPAGPDACVVHFDIGLGPWVTEQAGDGKGLGIERDDRAFFFGQAREYRRGTALAIAHNIVDREVRVVAVDQDGKEHVPGHATWGGGKHLKMLDVEFALPPDQLREYRLQSRPVGRFEIKNVALRPRKAGS
jgi:beta-lactamase regulating signal transducer with metallopeptidase domain